MVVGLHTYRSEGHPTALFGRYHKTKKLLRDLEEIAASRMLPESLSFIQAMETVDIILHTSILHTFSILRLIGATLRFHHPPTPDKEASLQRPALRVKKPYHADLGSLNCPATPHFVSGWPSGGRGIVPSHVGSP